MQASDSFQREASIIGNIIQPTNSNDHSTDQTASSGYTPNPNSNLTATSIINTVDQVSSPSLSPSNTPQIGIHIELTE